MGVLFLPRSAWGAGELGAGHRVPHGQFTGLAVHHTVSVLADYDRDGHLHGDVDDIARFMRVLQRARPDLGPEVPYSFVAFEGAAPGDCIVAEGRGWGVTGAHTKGHNSTRYGVAAAGNTSARPVTAGMLAGIRWVGRRLEDPAGARATIGHRDVKATECPGNSLYAGLGRIQPPFLEEDPMSALTDDEQHELLRRLRDVDTRSGAMWKLLADTGTIGRRSKETTIAVRALLARAGVDVDEAALAAELAPLLAANARALSDADLAAVATAVNDEAHRRSAS